MLKKDSFAVKALRSAFAFCAIATTLVTAPGCIIIIPAPGKSDPFQPPPAKPMALKKGASHKLRMTCGAKAVFQSQGATPEQFLVDFNAVNLQPVGQLETAAMRVHWRGEGSKVDVPLNVGDQSQRNAKGSFSATTAAGNTELVVSMEGKPACGAVNLTISFK